jgi:hypothetical protein
MGLLVAVLLGGGLFGPRAAAEVNWKVGVASVKITPQKSMWMAGYSARTKPSEGVAQDLFAKALAIEDGRGSRLVIVTMDLIGVPRPLRDQLEKRVQEQSGLAPRWLLLSASHTHCGPELREARLPDVPNVGQQARLTTAYTADLEQKLFTLVGDALAGLQPAQLDYLHARAGFAMNRRRPTERGFSNAPNSDGPVDHGVPVLRVTDPQGKLRAVLFGYACHNTTLGYYKFCGDYAGYAQQYLQESHPEMTALFMAGCGADQNPYPRRTEELAQQHGRTLSLAVQAALQTVPKPLRGPLCAALEEVTLDFAPPPAREELEKVAAGKKMPDAGHARRLLVELQETGKIRSTYPYPIQVIRFGSDLTMIALAGEVVVDYSLRLKRELAAGPPLWVAAYSNDVFGYVPSLRVLQEGGYEGGDAMRNTPLPGPFGPSVEERIVSKAIELARQPLD